MATRAQSKTAIDNAVTAAKADMDNIIPTTVNYTGGSLQFNPLGYQFILNANADSVTALLWFSTIQTNLTNANRPFTVGRNDRRIDDIGKKVLTVSENNGKFSVMIINF